MSIISVLDLPVVHSWSVISTPWEHVTDLKRHSSWGKLTSRHAPRRQWLSVTLTSPPFALLITSSHGALILSRCRPQAATQAEATDPGGRRLGGAPPAIVACEEEGRSEAEAKQRASLGAPRQWRPAAWQAATPDLSNAAVTQPVFECSRCSALCYMYIQLQTNIKIMCQHSISCLFHRFCTCHSTDVYFTNLQPIKCECVCMCVPS